MIPNVREAVAPGAPLVTEVDAKQGLFHGLGELAPRDGNVCYRYRIDRGELEAVFARADVVVEGEYEFPAVYQYAMETHTVIAQYEGDEISLWATCQHPFLVRAEIADLFGVPGRERAHPGAVPRRRLRLEVVHEDGAADGRARAQGRAARADPEPRVRVDGDDASAQHVVPHAHGGDRGRPPAGARRRVPLRHRRLRRQRPARRCHRRRCRSRSVPLGRLSGRRGLRLHEPRARRVVPGIRGDAPPVDRRVSGRRGRAPRGARPTRGAPREPLHAGRGSPGRRKAARCGPDRRRREGRCRCGLEGGQAAPRRPRPLRRAARRRRPSRVERRVPPGGGRPRRRPRQHHGDGAGAAHGVRADRGRGDRRRAGPGDGARRGHALLAVRPLDRCEPLDDHRRAGGAASRGRHPHAARRDRETLWTSTRPTISR